MYDRINFLRERVRLQESVLDSDRKIALISSIGVGVFFLIFVAVVGYRWLLGTQISQARAAADQAEVELAGLKSVADAYSRRKHLLGLTSLVVEKRTKAWDAIRYLYTVMPIESRIDSINLSGTDGSLEFTVKTPSIFSYKNLSDTLQSSQVAASGFSPQLGTLTRAKDGTYSLQVRLFMKTTARPNAEASESATL